MEPNFMCAHFFLSFFLSVRPISPYYPPPTYFHQCNCLFSLLFSSLSLSLSVFVLCPAASESVLLQQLFQSKLTQTGSLVPAAQGRIGLRGPKAALLLHRMPSVSLVTASSVPQKTRRYHDLTKVQYTIHSVVSLVLQCIVALYL